MLNSPLQEPIEDPQIFDILEGVGFSGRDAHATICFIHNMASANLIYQFGTKLDHFGAELNARIDAVETKIEAKIDAVEARIEAKIDAVDAKVDVLDTKIDVKTDALEVKIDAVDSKFKFVIWVIGIGISILIAMDVISKVTAG